MTSQEEDINDLHLSLDAGDNLETESVCLLNGNNTANHVTDVSDTLFLSRRGLKDITNSVLEMTKLKNLYLEGNEINSLPDTLFRSLPNLVWLDLRNNQLTHLPPNIGQHRNLRTLLLERNPIRELPPELGHLICLKALSLRLCPISFPPQEVVEQGLPYILQFLRSTMAERPLSVRTSHPVSEMPPVERLQLSELEKSSLDLCEEASDRDLRRFEELKQKMIQMDRADLGYSILTLPLLDYPRTAEGNRSHKKHPPPSLQRKIVSIKEVVPELPPFDCQYWKKSEERKLAAMKEFKEKQAILEQRRKDQELLHEWRNQAMVLQKRKTLERKQDRRERQKREESLRKIESCCSDSPLRLAHLETGKGLASESTVCMRCAESIVLQQSHSTRDKAQAQWGVKNIPYATETSCSDNKSKVQSNTSQSATQGVSQESETEQKQRSLRSRREVDESRAARDRELEQRIQGHVQMMQQRRRKSKGTAREETEAAKREMEEVKKLQSEVTQKKYGRDLEYRFTAFTG
ncbi:leucine-rich repeat-containing protein 27-like [Chanos chanos]|uniref:Leucine-rich repeat-containing protein 27-like n=1 Tax=Chanos chanos TaxID=29144 RepID=A0A6J2V599_CHACN|nr:leucine-rich repeat-containing protein 27 [Chanos chanos]